MGHTVYWKDDPEEHDYPAALDYLELQFEPLVAQGFVQRLQQGTTVVKKAKDIIRSSGLPLLPQDNAHVARNIQRAASGKLWSPVLLVRGLSGEPLIIADGYHRCCAAYYVSEDTEVRCRLA